MGSTHKDIIEQCAQVCLLRAIKMNKEAEEAEYNDADYLEDIAPLRKARIELAAARREILDLGRETPVRPPARNIKPSKSGAPRMKSEALLKLTLLLLACGFFILGLGLGRYIEHQPESTATQEVKR
jgi:hypothetical protein